MAERQTVMEVGEKNVGSSGRANKLLKNCRCGSKIYLALDDMPYSELGISAEVKDQVELMLMQLKRAKKCADTRDIELAMDMMVVFSKEKEGRNADRAILERLAKKLELHSIAESKEETVAVRKLAKRSVRQNAESIQQITDLLGKFKEIAGIYEDFLLDGPVSTRSLRRCFDDSS
ncbi:hypothetical protein C1H46_019319 [Malus baccata]|uniref:PUB 12/19-like N-terminal domain-containing protein n=1 Tax=Malus baccata TaxID=106549 RepID=A0A540M8I3_MALBA|nr:hypothetical protein C1H46_019319 [Malus baccata]